MKNATVGRPGGRLAVAHDPVAQRIEHPPSKRTVESSSLSWITNHFLMDPKERAEFKKHGIEIRSIWELKRKPADHFSRTGVVTSLISVHTEGKKILVVRIRQGPSVPVFHMDIPTFLKNYNPKKST